MPSFGIEQSVNESMLGSNNAFLVKRKSGGGSQFSRDPLNLMNKHSRKVGSYSQAHLSSYPVANDDSSMLDSLITRYGSRIAIIPKHECYDASENQS